MRGKFRRRGRAEQRGKTEEDVDEYQKLADEELIQKLREGDERIMEAVGASQGKCDVFDWRRYG